MKKILFISILAMAFSSVAFSQVTKEDLSFTLKQVGTSAYSIKTIEIRGYRDWFTDGTRDSKKTSLVYKSVVGNKKNTFNLFERGLQITTSVNGKKTITRFIPYSEISFILCNPEKLTVNLKDTSM